MIKLGFKCGVFVFAHPRNISLELLDVTALL